MIAASFWSLLNPAIELAESSGLYGSDGRYAFVGFSEWCLNCFIKNFFYLIVSGSDRISGNIL